MPRLLGTDQGLKEYQRYRKVGRDINHKIIDAYLNETILEKSTMMLRLGQKRQLVLDNEDDLSVLMDFALYEVRQRDGKNSVERYAEEKGGANAIERDLLAAMVKAQISLFRVNRVLPDKCQIVIENLVVPETSLALTDINFSQTMKGEFIVFFRPIHTAKFTMTSGVAFVFPIELEQELITRWQRHEWKGNAERYAWFFRKSKQSGYETRYM